MADRLPTLTIEDAQLIYKNFAGRETKYNKDGDRNFSVVLDTETAERLMADGWPVRLKEARDEEDDPFYHLPVKVKFGHKPPRIVLIAGESRTIVDEAMVEVLDIAEIETVDIILNPYAWEVGGKTGVAAYLKTMFMTIVVDELEKKYGFYAAPTEKFEGELQPGDDANE